MGVSDSGRRCPFPLLLAIFLAIVLAAAALMVRVPTLANAGLPVLGPLVATIFVGIGVEVWRRKANSCPWLDFETGRRVVMYLLLFIVGVFVVFPGIWPARSVEWVFRIPLLLLTVAGVALLTIHKAVDHGELEEAGVRRGIYFASRLPVYVLTTVGAFLAIAAVLSLISMVR
jgi:hypothetical protein